MQTLKRHAISFIVTFISAFLTVVLPFFETFKEGDILQPIIISGVFAGIRAVAKMMNELWFYKK